MNRLQQSGLIALFLLLAIAGVGSFLGRGKVTEASIDTSAVVLEPGSQVQEIDLYSRRERISSFDFQRGPQPGPLSDPSSERRIEAPRVYTLGGNGDGDGDGGVERLPVESRPPPVQRRILVRDGDTLQRIAGRELGDRQLWRLIASTNRLRDPFVIHTGQNLLLPTEEALANSRAALQPRNASAPSRGPQPEAGERKHLVARGETVGEISQRYYGTSKLYQRILQANGLSDPRELRAGKAITIPPPPQ